MCPDELLMELGTVRVQGGNNIKKCNMYDAYMRASTIPFKNALEMELMFAASQLENKAKTRIGYRYNPLYAKQLNQINGNLLQKGHSHRKPQGKCYMHHHKRPECHPPQRLQQMTNSPS